MQLREVCYNNQDMSDPKVSETEVIVKTARKWRAEMAVAQVESRLHHRYMVWTRRRIGLGTTQTPGYNKAYDKEHQHLVQDEGQSGDWEEVQQSIRDGAASWREEDLILSTLGRYHHTISSSWSSQFMLSSSALPTCSPALPLGLGRNTSMPTLPQDDNEAHIERLVEEQDHWQDDQILKTNL